MFQCVVLLIITWPKQVAISQSKKISLPPLTGMAFSQKNKLSFLFWLEKNIRRVFLVVLRNSSDISNLKCKYFLYPTSHNFMGEKTLKLVNILWFGHRPQNVPRLYDLVQVKNDQIRTAFFFALRNTLVADDLKQATNIAFQVKIQGWLLNKL